MRQRPHFCTKNAMDPAGFEPATYSELSIAMLVAQQAVHVRELSSTVLKA